MLKFRQSERQNRLIDLGRMYLETVLSADEIIGGLPKPGAAGAISSGRPSSSLSPVPTSERGTLIIVWIDVLFGIYL
jgi:hypothetical protein